MFDKIKEWVQRLATRKIIAAVVAALLLAVGISLPPEQVDAISDAITEIINQSTDPVVEE